MNERKEISGFVCYGGGQLGTHRTKWLLPPDDLHHPKVGGNYTMETSAFNCSGVSWVAIQRYINTNSYENASLSAGQNMYLLQDFYSLAFNFATGHRAVLSHLTFLTHFAQVFLEKPSSPF